MLRHEDIEFPQEYRLAGKADDAQTTDADQEDRRDGVDRPFAQMEFKRRSPAPSSSHGSKNDCSTGEWFEALRSKRLHETDVE